MSKTKYKFIQIKKTILYNELETLLEEEARNGWILLHFTNYFLKFKKDKPMNIKYQIDFSSPTLEYKELLKHEGYEFVDNNEELSIYKNNNHYAQELQTDETTRLLALIKYFSLKHPLLYIIVDFLFFLFIYFFKLLISGPKTLGHIYETFGFYMFYFFLITIFVCNIFNLCQNVAAKYSLNREIHQKESCLLPFTIFHKLYDVSFILILMFFIYFFITRLLVSPLSIGVIVLLIIVIYLIQYIYKKILYQIEPGWIQKLLKAFFIITCILISIQLSNTEIPVIMDTTPYMSDSNITPEKSNNLLVASNTWSLSNDEQTYKYESINSCINKDIALEIFKNNIIYYEREARIPTDEEIEKITEENESWTLNDIPYFSYDQAIQHMKTYQSSLIDQCYYNDDVVIALKDNIILICYKQTEDHYIDNIINHYFYKII